MLGQWWRSQGEAGLSWSFDLALYQKQMDSGVFFAHSRNQLTVWHPSILLSRRAVGMPSCHSNLEADTTLTVAPVLITGLLPVSKAQPSPTTSALIPGLLS